MTRTQIQQMDDIALCEYAETPAAIPWSNLLLLELVDRFRPHAQAPDAYPFPTHEEEPAL